MANPTVTYAEKRLAGVEGAEKVQLFASGMAAVTSLFFTLLKSGDHLILTSDSYRRTRDFVRFLGKFGVSMSIVDPTVEAVADQVRPSTRLVFTEVPSNPYLNVLDIPRLVELGRSHSVLTVVDSTFATPVNLKPLELGVDFVLHSATKYLGGHNDLIAGLLAGRNELIQPVSEMLMTLGGVCDPNTAFLLERGLKTLEVRVARQNSSGMAVASFLEGQPKVKNVFYPGLESHPHHQIAATLLRGFGGVVTFLLNTDFDGTTRFIDALRIPVIAPSLGGVESLVEQVVVMSYWNLSPEERQKLGFPDNLVRLSVGVEDTEDLLEDLSRALGAI